MFLKEEWFCAILGLLPFRGADTKIINRVEELNKKLGISMMHVSISWLAAKGRNPIIGVSSVKAVDEIVEAANFTLSEEDIKYLEEPNQAKYFLKFSG